MTNTFSIVLNHEHFDVRELHISEDCGTFEIWMKCELQFIVHHVMSENDTTAWQVGPVENYNMSEAYINEIGCKIEAHFD
jgi:hypothetical protein